MDFFKALTIARRGFDQWASEPHNKRWFRRIDGTPIPNDLLVNIAEAMVADAKAQTEPPQP